MAITQAMCTSFKSELLQAVHNFKASGGNSFKLSLYTNSAVLGKSTTSFTTDAQVSNSGQYTSGGGALVNGGTSLSTNTAIVDFADRSFTGVTLTARGALIYNTTTDGGSNTTDAVAVLDFGGDKTATSGTFTITFPAAEATAAILRIA